MQSCRLAKRGARIAPRRGERGAVMLEYILIATLLVLSSVALAPATIGLFGYAYEVLAAVVCSPFPAGY